MRFCLKQVVVSISLLLGISLCHTGVMAQEAHGSDVIPLHAVVVGTDTIPEITLAIFDVVAKMPRALRKQHERWTRLRNAVYVTYPYAKKAGAVFNDISAHLATIPDKHKRKEYVKSREKELRSEFTKPLTDLSVYQGKVLMKLIARETGNTCYDIIQDYKGSFSAGFWQSVAWVFGSSLKQTYNAVNEDSQIENIVLEVRRMYGYY